MVCDIRRFLQVSKSKSDYTNSLIRAYIDSFFKTNKTRNLYSDFDNMHGEITNQELTLNFWIWDTGNDNSNIFLVEVFYKDLFLSFSNISSQFSAILKIEIDLPGS